jgi:PBP1b-binding outer membrane lipoprotein LpoB
MKKIIAPLVLLMLFLVACSNEPGPTETQLTQEEKQAVEERMQKDQQAMDSLESALMGIITSEQVGDQE